MNQKKVYPPGYRKHNVIPIEGDAVLRVLLSKEPRDWTKTQKKPFVNKKIKTPDIFNY